MTDPGKNDSARTSTGTAELPPLAAGERLDQPTFHARYEAMPHDVKAELIDGVVYMQAALKSDHGRVHTILMTWLGWYQAQTPGTDALDNATVILSDRSEPQPDACLRILTECGGQADLNEDDYVVGAPEWVGEIALSSKEIDLGPKRRDYERAAVQEYVVLVLGDRRVIWHVRDGEKLAAVDADEDGIYRSRIFPALWLDPTAILDCDTRRVIEVLNQGLATDEHNEFVARLQQRRQA